jgi:hypothetical protein
MPNWLGGLLAFGVLFGFIGYAFRQGTKVKPNGDGNRHDSMGGGISSDGGGHYGGGDGHHGV